MTDVLKIGILGAARIAPNAIMAPAAKLDNVEVTSIAARSEQRAEAFAKEHGIANIERDYNALIAREDVDLVYVPLPVSSHFEWTERALQTGKHVLCEKPFGMNHQQAKRAIAATSPTARLIEAFHYRYHPSFIQLMEIVESGQVGKVAEIEAVFCTQILDEQDIRYNPALGGGAMMDLGCYPLHQVRSLLHQHKGEVLEASADLSATGVDVAMRAELAFGPTKVKLECAMNPDEFFVGFIKVRGERGTIEIINPIAPQFGCQFSLTDENGRQDFSVSKRPTYEYQLEAIERGLASGVKLPTEGEDIAQQQALLDEIYSAAGLSHLRLENGPR